MTGLYVHVPFCARACPYCDFDFEVGRSPDAGSYLEGLAREVEGRVSRGDAIGRPGDWGVLHLSVDDGRRDGIENSAG